MLFQALSSPDRTKTQLAYSAQYMPMDTLSAEAHKLIVFRRLKYLRKHQIEQILSDDMTTLSIDNDITRQFRIVWEYNAIPTELEWTRKSAAFIIRLDYRVVKDIGQIVQLSFN